jgi:hypothetical protein
MNTHPHDLLLSDYLDRRAVADGVRSHCTSCSQCCERLDAFREIREAAGVERHQTYDAPDIWPTLASLTVHRSLVQRLVLRELRGQFIVGLLVAFVLGVMATEALRASARAVAATAARVAPSPDSRAIDASLRQIERLDGRR